MPANKNAPIEVYDGKYYRYADLHLRHASV